MAVNRRTRILFYVPTLALGGLERRLGRLATALDRNQFECIVCWSRYWGLVGNMLSSACVPVHQIPLHDAAGQAEATARIRELEPDIFHSFSCSQNAFDVLAAESAKVPVIVTSRVNTREWDSELKVQQWELVRNRATHWVTAVSDAVANLTIRVEGIPRQRITVIHNGVETPQVLSANALRKELKLTETAPLIGCVGNYRPAKGHQLLLEAFRGVLGVCPEAHLVCCGLDPRGLKAQCGEFLARHGMERNVSLLDSRADVDSVYQGLDVYVQPSLFEGFSNAILEAMANGLPVVATSVGGNPEAIVDGLTGLVTEPGDAAALARAMVALVTDPERRLTMGRAGQARFRERFQVTAMVDAYAKLYAELQQPDDHRRHNFNSRAASAEPA